jgi:hypothetical protein
VVPLRTGKVAPGALEALFDPGAAAKLVGPDRALLVDEGFPPSDGLITATSPPIEFFALADGDRKPLVVSVRLDLDITARVQTSTVHIERAGQLVLEPGTGGWKITGWMLTVDRNGPGLAVTPTTAGTTSSSGPRATTTTRKP